MASELAPGFLVAAPSLRDPNFERSVVLLIEHRSEGSLGFIVNRPAAHLTFRSVVEDLGLCEDTASTPDVPVMVGGPVQPYTGWIVFDPRSGRGPVDGCIEVSLGLKVSASRDFLKDLARTERVDRHLLVLGYAGWGAGQLDGELRQGAWIPVDLHESIVFETPFEDRWKSALNALGIDPSRFVGQVPSA